jgi:DNA modification methylase
MTIAGAKRVKRIGDATLILGDCLEVMPGLGEVDAVVTDPPYGIGALWRGTASKAGFAGAGGRLWDGSQEWDEQTNPGGVFAALEKAGGRGIVWGGNYYNLPLSRGYLIWDKMQSGFSLADSEMAWVSDPVTPKTFRFARAQLAMEGKEHPTQKPVALMEWCLTFLPKAETILDPFAGSGTTGVACAKMGRKFIGIELDEGYFDIACRRIREAYSQPDMFIEPPKKAVQTGLDL